ncbi:MAG: hypothetical protein LC112_00775 [Flavobacteriales bacterium]|nr:hypothetical protein [Flavobacteriales bacterium]
MNYLYMFLVVLFFSCDSQSANAAADKINFEEVSHFFYPLISEQYLVLNTQEKIDSVYKVIHSKSPGNRLAPIPSLSDNESYIIFKPLVKNSNDVEIKEISQKGNTIYVDVGEFHNPDVQKSSRISPYVLVKLLKKVNPKKIVFNYQKLK